MIIVAMTRFMSGALFLDRMPDHVDYAFLGSRGVLRHAESDLDEKEMFKFVLQL
jgi:hypothetical protein